MPANGRADDVDVDDCVDAVLVFAKLVDDAVLADSAAFRADFFNDRCLRAADNGEFEPVACADQR
jgi:hypothetical protein